MSTKRLLVAVAFAAVAFAARALADQPSGCAAFKWPLDHERAALLGTKQAVTNGGALLYDSAAILKLAPLAEAGLPHDPERAPKIQNSFAGHFSLAAPAKAGLYKVTIASQGWVDVLDNGAFLHPKGFSDAKDCEGARKSVKFALPESGVTLQLSGVKDSEIRVIISPAE